MVESRGLEIICDEMVKFMGICYSYPTTEKIANPFTGLNIDNPFYGRVPKEINFGFGTQKELNLWLVQHKNKYPLIWLTYPYDVIEKNEQSTEVFYKKVRFVFATDNTVDKLVDNRVLTTKMVLEQIIAKFKEILYSSFNKGELYSEKHVEIRKVFYPNYASSGTKYDSNFKSEAQPKSLTVDIWDAFTVDINLVQRKKYC